MHARTRRTDAVTYPHSRTYMLIVGQAISDNQMGRVFDTVDIIHEAGLLGLVVIDELQA